ncbi:MAG: glycosyltransferase [archaeon]|nr:glycosyltransferase [archaeon]
MTLLSVLVPVYNSHDYLEESLNSILTQGIVDMEIICIDDSSTDDSLDILRRYADKDPRIRIISQEHKGAGAARNRGIEEAKGRYIHFMDSDDWLEKGAYTLILGLMERSGVDVCVFQRFHYDSVTGNNTVHRRAFTLDNYISNIDTDPLFFIRSPVVPWNKIIRKTLIDEHRLRYDELVCANDRTFYFSLIRNAKSIMINKECLVHYRINNSKSLIGTTRSLNYECHFEAYESTMKHYEDMSEEVRMALMDVSFIDMLGFFEKASVVYQAKIYSQLHNFLKKVDLEKFRSNAMRYVWFYKFEFIKKHAFGFPVLLGYNYERKVINHMSNKPFEKKAKEHRMIDGLIVSFTTYKERTKYLPTVYKSILGQTYVPEKTILWVSKEEYDPDNLPYVFKWCIRNGLEIRFVDDDLKSHKKYLYAMQEYPDKTIITIDDDVVYDNKMIEKLWEAHEAYPEVVIGSRVHKMAVSEDGIDKYDEWTLNDYTLYYKPSNLGMATGVGGILYPAGCLPDIAFDKETIKKICLYEDDLWLKMMEMCNGVKTMSADMDLSLNYIKGTQEQGLYHKNINDGKNDKAIRSILDYLEGKNLDPLKNIYDSDFVEKDYLGLIVDFRKDVDIKLLVSICNAFRSKIKAICYYLTDNETEKMLIEKLDPTEYTIVRPGEINNLPLNSLIYVSGCTRILYLEPNLIHDADEFIEIIESLSSKTNSLHISKELHELYGIEQKNDDFDLRCTVINAKCIKNSGLQHLNDRFSRDLFKIYLSKKKGQTLRSERLDPTLYNSESLYNIRAIVKDLEIDLEMPDDDICRYLKGDSDEKYTLLDNDCRFPAIPYGLVPKRCPICKTAAFHFTLSGPYPRDNAKCPICDSLEFHRAMSLVSSNSLKHSTSDSDYKDKDVKIYYVNYPEKSKEALEKSNIIGIGLDDIDKVEPITLINLCHVFNMDTKDRFQNILKSISDKMVQGGYLILSEPIEKKSNEIPVVKHLDMDIYETIRFLNSLGFKTEAHLINDKLPLNRIVYSSLYAKETVFIAKYIGKPEARSVSPQD